MHLIAIEKMTGLLESNADNVLAALHSQLGELVDEARGAVDELAGCETTEQAVANGRAEPWQRLQQLWAQHQQIRAAQSAMMHSYMPDEFRRARSPYMSDPLMSDVFASNLDEVLPGWRRPIAPDSFNFGGDVTPANAVPWPADGPAALCWLVRHGAQLWVPTRRELRRLWARRAGAPLSPRTNPKPDVSREGHHSHRRFAGRTA